MKGTNMTETLPSEQPNRLYRYMSNMDYITDMLVDNRFYCANPFTEFNDPFDCLTYLNLKGQEKVWRQWFDKFKSLGYILEDDLVEKIIKDAEAYNFDLSEIKDFEAFLKGDSSLADFYNKFKVTPLNQDLRVLCLSLFNNETLLWSHYADKHKGVCFGFEVVHVNEDYRFMPYEKDSRKYSITFNRVEYRSERYGLNFFDYALEEKQLKEDFLFHKYEAWRYEQEYRYAVDKNALINEKYLEFNKVLLKEVVFGINSDNEDSISDKEKIISIIKNDTEYDVEFYQARKHVNEYKVINERIYPKTI